MKLLCHCFSFS